MAAVVKAIWIVIRPPVPIPAIAVIPRCKTERDGRRTIIGRSIVRGRIIDRRRRLINRGGCINRRRRAHDNTGQGWQGQPETETKANSRLGNVSRSEKNR